MTRILNGQSACCCRRAATSTTNVEHLSAAWKHAMLSPAPAVARPRLSSPSSLFSGHECHSQTAEVFAFLRIPTLGLTRSKVRPEWRLRFCSDIRTTLERFKGSQIAFSRCQHIAPNLDDLSSPLSRTCTLLRSNANSTTCA